jgi:hypothetical protein
MSNTTERGRADSATVPVGGEAGCRSTAHAGDS